MTSPVTPSSAAAVNIADGGSSGSVQVNIFGPVSRTNYIDYDSNIDFWKFLVFSLVAHRAFESFRHIVMREIDMYVYLNLGPREVPC